MSTAIVTSLSSMILPNLAYAQAQSAQGQTAVLEEITVTAERVSSSLQTTPIAISAFTPEGLSARQITNVLQAAAAIPGVMITPTTGGSNSARIHMRGAGQENGGVLYDPAVGVYIDNIYMPRINGAFFDLFDIDRLEVLRGPQGTLYGRNTNGGAIKIVTKRPSMDFQAAAYLVEGRVPRSVGNDHPVATPMGVVPTLDGHINIGVAGERQWAGLCKAIGRPDLESHPDYATQDLRLRHRAQLKAELALARGGGTGGSRQCGGVHARALVEVAHWLKTTAV